MDPFKAELEKAGLKDIQEAIIWKLGDIIIIIIIIVYFPIRYNYNLSIRFNDFTQSSEKRLIPEP